MKNKVFNIEFDEATGGISSLVLNDDETGMNWVIEKRIWVLSAVIIITAFGATTSHEYKKRSSYLLSRAITAQRASIQTDGSKLPSSAVLLRRGRSLNGTPLRI